MQDIEIITSSSNPTIKLLRSLHRKKARRDANAFLVEGARLIEDALRNDWRPVTMAIAPEMLERDYARDIIKRAMNKGARCLQVNARILGQIANKDNPQTLVAAFEPKQTTLADIPLDGAGEWIALYEVRDPGNLGTILRTADCAGVRGVLLVEECCDPYSVEAVRASMGSLFNIPFTQTNFDEMDSWRRDANLKMIAASVNGTVRHDKAGYGDKSLIIMGNEQKGLPEAVEALCDTLALIPMRGGADSLNLAQATALMTYEAWRQRDFDGAR